MWFNEKTAGIPCTFPFFPRVVEQFNLWVPTAFLFTVMPIYVHQVASRIKIFTDGVFSSGSLLLFLLHGQDRRILLSVTLPFFNPISFLLEKAILGSTFSVMSTLLPVQGWGDLGHTNAFGHLHSWR